MKVQWLGGPADGDWVEIQDGMEALEIFEGPSFDIKTSPTRFIPIVEKVFGQESKLILDYYAKG